MEGVLLSCLRLHAGLFRAELTFLRLFSWLLWNALIIGLLRADLTFSRLFSRLQALLSVAETHLGDGQRCGVIDEPRLVEMLRPVRPRVVTIARSVDGYMPWRCAEVLEAAVMRVLQLAYGNKCTSQNWPCSRLFGAGLAGLASRFPRRSCSHRVALRGVGDDAPDVVLIGAPIWAVLDCISLFLRTFLLFPGTLQLDYLPGTASIDALGVLYGNPDPSS